MAVAERRAHTREVKGEICQARRRAHRGNEVAPRMTTNTTGSGFDWLSLRKYTWATKGARPTLRQAQGKTNGREAYDHQLGLLGQANLRGPRWCSNDQREFVAYIHQIGLLGLQ